MLKILVQKIKQTNDPPLPTKRILVHLEMSWKSDLSTVPVEYWLILRRIDYFEPVY